MGKIVKKSKPAKEVKPVKCDDCGFALEQYNVPKSIAEDKKIKPKDVFEGFKEKKTKKKSKVIKNDTAARKNKKSGRY